MLAHINTTIKKHILDIVKPPYARDRNYPTFFLSIIAANMIAGIYFWHTQSYIFALVPVLTILVSPPYAIASSIFLCTTLYCSLLEFSYIRVQQSLFGYKISGIAHIQSIYHNELKDNFKITCRLNPYGSNHIATIQIFIPKLPPQLALGALVELKDIYFQPPQKRTYKNYLLKESIHATTYCTALNHKIIKDDFGYRTQMQRLAVNIESRISKKLSNISRILFSSLFLGSKKYAEIDSALIKDPFNKWGLNHFLARSGLHVSLLLFLIFFVLRLSSLRVIYSNIITVAFLCIYTALSYTSISFARSLLMALVAIWCTIQRVPVNLLHILLITLIALLLYNPFSVLFLDFQLTFLLTFGLCLLPFA